MNTELLEQARQLSAEEQLELVEALWDELALRQSVPLPTPAQERELDRRLREHEASPDDSLTWNEVKASALARIKK